ncbi:MAG TPA: cupin domain-containing protein [Streptosporangiaceae bacterium]
MPSPAAGASKAGGTGEAGGASGRGAASGPGAASGASDPVGASGSGSARLRLIRGSDLSSATAQTVGMMRTAAISGDLVGAQSLWMGRTTLPAGVSSGDHHHGDSETGIYVVSGSPVFVCRDAESGELVRLEAQPGDYIWVPPHARHREENPSPDTEAVVVIARSTQEAIVVNVEAL